MPPPATGAAVEVAAGVEVAAAVPAAVAGVVTAVLLTVVPVPALLVAAAAGAVVDVVAAAAGAVVDVVAEPDVVLAEDFGAVVVVVGGVVVGGVVVGVALVGVVVAWLCCVAEVADDDDGAEVAAAEVDDGAEVAAADVDTAVDAGEDAYDAHRLALGVPDPARDCEPDRTFPLEADADLLNAIDFHKGCYIGQETTSRMKRRSAVKTRMVPIVFDGPAPPFGAPVQTEGGLRAGEALSGRDGRALALLRLDRAVSGPLVCDGRPVTLDIPPWWPEGTLPSPGAIEPD